MPQEPELRAAVYVRSYTPISNPQNQVIQAARALTGMGRFDEVEVETVPQSVRRSGAQTPVEARYEEFKEWAADHGFSISQPFRVRESVNRITGETIEKLVMPIVCLAVYENDDLAAVLPCETDDGHITVLDYLDSLADGIDPLGTLALGEQRSRDLVKP